MSYLCNRVCENKTSYGYCKTTYCIYPEFPHRAVGYTSAKPKTNADRIRSMTDEELAEFINMVWGNGRAALHPHNGWHDWLKEEVKGDGL